MGFFKLTIRDVPLDNQTILLRADYNVPLNSKGEISDDLRIRASLPTIEYLLEKGCKIVIISHLGRPEGRDEKLSLEPIAERLATLLKKDVRFIDETIGDKVYQVVKRASKNSIIMLENLRFYKEEEADDLDFAKKIAKASGARYFVQDGFGVVHRAHASTHAITLCIPSVAGLLVEKEYTMITTAMQSPKKPLVAVMGGAKVSDKIPLIERFVELADTIIVGGALSNTFLAHKGVPVGKSLVEPDQYSEIDRIYKAVTEKGEKVLDDFIVLPVDVAVAPSIASNARRRVVGLGDVESEDDILDIGDQSIERMVEIVKSAGTVIWNGTLGYAEQPAFAHGSARLALALASQPETTSIIGGGDTADFALKWDGHGGKSFTHVSTGGGASLELMSGDKLPGVESLLDSPGSK
ncbi:MAG: pgk, phosphoglycerate kinase [Candidatus Saccharibacteria bacterium]|nr:pgk, phosphoglycerate kinase [Candidatus Saccharibacteria bacterium]